MSQRDPDCRRIIDDLTDPTKYNQGDAYSVILIMRDLIISISALALIINIIVIIRSNFIPSLEKQYKFNTIRLFLFVQIFYALSLISVLPHNSSLNAGLDQWPDEVNQAEFRDYMNVCIARHGQAYECAFQGFINLTCYSISYWFAVCITLYIRLVLQNNHKMFMKKKGTLIFVVITIVIIWYLVPFFMTFFQDMPFSFGPTGYKFDGHKYFFYSGIVSRVEEYGFLLVALWMLVLPISMFIYHITLLWRNLKDIRKLTQLDELNPRQWFLIRSGKLSFFIFVVQMLNVGKLVLSFFSDISFIIVWVVFVLNTIFDLLALALIWMYLKYYYREGRNLQQDSEIMNRSLASSFATLTTSII